MSNAKRTKPTISAKLFNTVSMMHMDHHNLANTWFLPKFKKNQACILCSRILIWHTNAYCGIFTTVPKAPEMRIYEKSHSFFFVYYSRNSSIFPNEKNWMRWLPLCCIVYSGIFGGVARCIIA